MGDNSNLQGVRFYAKRADDSNISFFNYMLDWLHDFVNTQIAILEARGAWIIVPILSVEAYIFSFFANLTGVHNTFDLIKNTLLSLIGIAMGTMGVINMYIGTKQKMRKYKKELKEIKEESRKGKIA